MPTEKNERFIYCVMLVKTEVDFYSDFLKYCYI